MTGNIVLGIGLLIGGIVGYFVGNLDAWTDANEMMDRRDRFWTNRLRRMDAKR